MLTSRPTHGGGAPFGIDLEAGVAKITVRRPAVPDAPAPEEADAAAAAGQESGSTTHPAAASNQDEQDEQGAPRV